MDNKNPLVSVVFTSYNHKEYLKKALDSLINQSYKNIEIIIIDDKSTDGSQEVLKNYKNIYNVNLILNEENSGSYVLASNFGATFAKGDYILFAQCDDFSESNQIELLVKYALENQNCGVIFSCSNLVDEQGNVFATDFDGREHNFKKHVNYSSIIEGNLMSDFLTFSCVLPNLSAALVEKKLYEEVGKLSESFIVVSDWEFWLKLSQLTNFFYIERPLNNFRQHPTTIRSSVKMKVQILEIFRMFQNHIKLYSFTKKQVFKFHLGFGAIWFSYFLENKKQWLTIFIDVYKIIYKELKFSMMFLIFGFIKFIYEHIFRLFNKLVKN